MVKDYDCEILYHPGKANVVADALSRKAVAASIRDICLRMTVITPLLEQIREAPIEGLKEECQKCERIDAVNAFCTTRCREGDKVRLASCILKGRA